MKAIFLNPISDRLQYERASPYYIVGKHYVSTFLKSVYIYIPISLSKRLRCLGALTLSIICNSFENSVESAK